MLINLDIDPSNVDTDGIGDAMPITTADTDGIADALPVGTSWTQAGDAQYITESVNSAKSQHIIVTTVADETTPQSTMTLTGTDRDEAAVTDTVALPNAGTVVTTKQFLTVTALSVDVLTTGVVDVGWIITSWNSDETALWVATGAGDGLAHRRKVITTGNEDAGNDPLLVLTGHEADGNAITETVTLPDISSVETAKYFLTCTEATTNDKTLQAVFDIGWVDEVASRTVRLDWKRDVPSNYQLDISGTINVSLVFTMDIFDEDTLQSDIKFLAGDAAITSETADTVVVTMPSGSTGFRVVIGSYTDTAEVQVRATQAEAI